MSSIKAAGLRLALFAAALTAPVLQLTTFLPWQHGQAMAEQQTNPEKQAFEAAKDLGTVEAWDAFLSNYSSGFYSDLARAYVKKLADAPVEQPASAAPAGPAPGAYPAPAGSWGGVVRDGPGQNYRKVDSLPEGDPVTLLGPTDVMENGYPWFRITYSGGGSGYQWGGILCSTGAVRADLYKTCTTGAQRPEREASPPKKQVTEKPKRTCGSGQFYDKQKGRCMSFESQEDGSGELNNPPPKKNTSGMSCKQLKARCSKTDRTDDCDVYLNSCTGKGDN